MVQITQTDISDEAILALISRPKDMEKGFRLLMAKYQERVYWQVRRMLNNHEDANDVVQNCFVKVYRHIHSFEGRSGLYTWLYRIASNEAISFLNKRQRHHAAPLDDGENQLANTLKAEPELEAEVIQQKLNAAMATLPEKQRMVFELRYYDEMSYRDMSAQLGTSEGGLKASYHHAVKKITSFMTEQSS